MRKFEKLYLLKQIIKVNAECGKYCRLTNKLRHPKEFDDKLSEARKIYNELHPTTITGDSRLLHTAYSLLKGNLYNQIETSVKSENVLTGWEWKAIIKIMELYKDEENQVVIPTSPFPITLVNEPKKVEVLNK